MSGNKMERFTVRSKRVMEFTQSEANRLQHRYIGTEHLLLGLLLETGGIAYHALKKVGLDAASVTGEVEQLTQNFPSVYHGIIDLSEELKQTLHLAVDEARRMMVQYVGTEHLLLGLIRQSNSPAAQILQKLGASPDRVRQEVRELIQSASEPKSFESNPKSEPNTDMISQAFSPNILPLRQRLPVRNAWLQDRLNTLMPELMAREGFDLWLVIAREYNEDPVILSLIPEPSMSARRRTILAFYRAPDGTVQRFSVDRYGFRDFYEPRWDPESGEEQYACLARIIRELNPQTIGINTSDIWPFGDGLTHSEYERLADALGPDLMGRTKSAARMCVGWLERRIPAEIAAYPGIIEIGHALIAEAFSPRVIHPGVTTTDDVVWWFRQTMLDMGVQAWFHPTVEIQAPGQGFNMPAPGMRSTVERRNLILPGDVLHCDVGFTYLGLTTDHQQMAYVLSPGETDAPAGLKKALAAGNRLQDILMAEMQVGRTGNAILKAAREKAISEGIKPSIYSHPLGVHGHAAGPTIGLWDKQEGVPGQGDYELFDDTVYSIELNAVSAVPEWDNQEVRIALEEDAVLTGGKMGWLHGRQTAFHLIG